MEQMEIISKVISKVDEPTEWCAGMVVVPKANWQGSHVRGSNQAQRKNRQGVSSLTPCRPHLSSTSWSDHFQ